MFQRLLQRNERHRKKLEGLARLSALGLFYSEEDERRRVRALEESAAALGLFPMWDEVKFEPPEAFLWPENVAIWRIFQACSTQWMHGVGGPTGLNYPGVEVVMRMRRVKQADREDVFMKIGVMERAMLNAWSEKRNG